MTTIRNRNVKSIVDDKDHWLVRGMILRQNLLEEFGAHFTDCPPNVNKWFPQGGPGYEEGFEEFMESQYQLHAS